MIKFNEINRQMATDGTIVQFVALITQFQLRPMKNGRDFMNLELTTKQGVMNGKKWTVTTEDREKIKNGIVVECTAKIDEYEGKLNFNIQEIKPVEIDINEFVLTAIEPAKALEEEFKGYVKQIKNKKIKAVIEDLMNNPDVAEKFWIHPAAKSMHHNERHGLLYHTTRMLRAAMALVPVYDREDNHINKDLIIAGIIFHDIGKVYELDQIATGAGEYTKQSLIGHICLGYKWICEYEFKGMLDKETAFQLGHIVLSHHGKQEYGSPVSPSFKEAAIVNAVDGLDAKMMAMETEMLRLQPDQIGDNTNLCVGSHVFKPIEIE